MRAFEKSSLTLTLSAFVGLAAAGCVASADDVGEAEQAWEQETPPVQGTTPPAPPSTTCNCNCNCPTTTPPAPPPPAPPPTTTAPPPPIPGQPTYLPQPIYPPPFAGPVTTPIPIGGCGVPVGGVLPVGCGTPVAPPCCCDIDDSGFPAGFHTIVWPFSGTFLAIPGLRNCWLAGCGC